MPELPDELVEEVFLRLPPDEPAALVRASLASKPWRGVLTGPAFRGRYREFHGAPPMLGFLYVRPIGFDHDEDDSAPLFISTTKCNVRVLRFTEPAHQCLDAWDCRHGRVLLLTENLDCPDVLVVWDPMTGCTRELYGYWAGINAHSFGVAVLCAVSGCDHRACHAAPFKVVYVSVANSEEEDEWVALARTSSPDMGDWSKPSKLHSGEWNRPCLGLHLAAGAFIWPMPAVLVNDALHFLLAYSNIDDDRVGILKYSLSSDSLSLIDAPLAESVVFHDPILMAVKDGTLGFAHVDSRLTLCVWSRHIGSDGVVSWTHHSVVDLNNLLPIEDPEERPRLIGSVEGGDILFVNIDLGVYEIHLMTLEWKEHLTTLEWKERLKEENLNALIPYMSSYNPLERVIPGDAAH